ncbi:MAG: arylsulfatase [Actinomycetota bacterium]|nr:arylsulfatase [Actinomycetota bacterium]
MQTGGTRNNQGRPAFGGVIGRTYADSTPWWPPLPSAPDGAPNVVLVLLDDVGYAQFGCYGSDIATPTFDRLAAEGLRYTNFHTTALCSPTRACLLTGRNHHSNGVARVVDLAAGFPGYNATIPRENGFLSEILRDVGYATFAVGKWHLAPLAETANGSPRDKWPLGRGFDRFYGFMEGETDQFHPSLVHDNHAVDPPRTPEEGYHLTEDLADHAIQYVRDLRAVSPDKPFFLWFTPGACHAPHQAPRAHIDRYRGHFDQGWDVWRTEVFERQLAAGVLPPGTELSERPSWVPAWDSLSADQQRLYARMMEVFAAFLTHTDEQVQRLVDHLTELGELDDTVFVVMSDNGASAEGGPGGLFNEQYFFNFVPESLEENLARIDQLGSPGSFNHYPWGWAWAGNTPLKRFKRDTHEGGVADPLIVHWPDRIGRPGETRRQYVHAIDLVPTLLEAIGIEPPTTIAGVEQTSFEGTSFAPSLTDGSVPGDHVTQYYEMLGSRALYHDGWKAVVFHSTPFLAYDGSDLSHDFDDDVWELYHVAEDFSEVHDLAAERPDKLEELKALWWSEAERFQVLPLNNQPGRFTDTRYRRQRHELLPGVGPLAEAVAPHLKRRGYTMAAELVVADGPVDGVLVAHGCHSGGYVLFVRDRRLHFTYNWLGTTITTVSASEQLPLGPLVVTAVFTPSADKLSGTLELFYGDVPMGQGHIPHTTPLSYGVTGFAVGFQVGGPIEPGLIGRCDIPDGVLRRVVIETASRAADPTGSSERVDLATQ